MFLLLAVACVVSLRALRTLFMLPLIRPALFRLRCRAVPRGPGLGEAPRVVACICLFVTARVAHSKSRLGQGLGSLGALRGRLAHAPTAAAS